jgi:hypothetical protein
MFPTVVTGQVVGPNWDFTGYHDLPEKRLKSQFRRPKYSDANTLGFCYLYTRRNGEGDAIGRVRLIPRNVEVE